MDDENDSTFEALDATSDTAFGPRAVLLYGFGQEELPRIHELLRAIGALEHAVVGCTTTMGTWTVEQALAGADDGKLLPVGPVPRVALLSGLTDHQVDLVLDQYTSTGLPRPIFAMATPTNLTFTVVQLLEDLVAERAADEGAP